jgi:hypothetical protein
MLSSYGTPVEGIMDLIGAPEDVARFDLAVAVKQGMDKDAADKKLGHQPHPVMIDLRRALVRFAWSRSESQVVWEEGAEDLAASRGVAMAKDYDHHIPLVEPSEQDVKIARVAVSLACRTFSTLEDDPDTVFVRRCHVEFAEQIMREVYNGDLGYGEYSEYRSRSVLNTAAAKQALIDVDPSTVSNTCRALLGLRRVNPNSLSMVLALDSNDARAFMAKMAQVGAAVFDQENSRNTAMTWTPEFMTMLRALEKNPPVNSKDDAF